MAVDLSIEGTEKLTAVAHALKAYGRKDLSRELYAGLNRATKPIRAAARTDGVKRLPQRGGLRDRVAKTRLSTRRRAGRDPSVRIVAADNAVADPEEIDRGRLHHPTYGHGPVVVQPVTPGWFTDPMEAGAPMARQELVNVLDSVARKITLAQSSAPRSGR